MYSGDTTDPNYCGGTCQDFSVWQNRIRMPEVEQAYNNSDSYLNIQAWHSGSPNGPYNAGVNVSPSTGQTEVLSKDTSVEAVFKGGFVPKCESDQVWQKTQDTGNTWRCSGQIPWDQTVYLPEFQNNDAAGIIFPPYNFINDQSNLPDYIYNYDQNQGQLGAGFNSFEVAARKMDFLFSDEDVDHIDARCWEGNQGIDVNNPPSDVEVTDWFQINVPSNPSDPVAGYRELNHNGDYSCYWSVTTSGGKTEDGAVNRFVEVQKYLGKTPSGKIGNVVKAITEDSSYASDLPDMTGTDHDWTKSELDDKIASWN